MNAVAYLSVPPKRKAEAKQVTGKHSVKLQSGIYPATVVLSETKAITTVLAHVNEQHVGADTEAQQQLRGSSCLREGPERFMVLSWQSCYGQC